MKKYFLFSWLISLNMVAGEIQSWPSFDDLPYEVVLNIYDFMGVEAAKLAAVRKDLWKNFPDIQKRRIDVELGIPSEIFFKNVIYDEITEDDYIEHINIIWSQIVEHQYKIFDEKRVRKGYDRLIFFLASAIFNLCKVSGGVIDSYYDVKKKNKCECFRQEKKMQKRLVGQLAEICDIYQYTLIDEIDRNMILQGAKNASFELGVPNDKLISLLAFDSLMNKDYKSISKHRKKSLKNGKEKKTLDKKKIYFWYWLYARGMIVALSKPWLNDFAEFMSLTKEGIDALGNVDREKFLQDLTKGCQEFESAFPFLSMSAKKIVI